MRQVACSEPGTRGRVHRVQEVHFRAEGRYRVNSCHPEQAGHGTLYFGVRNDGEVCGQDVSDTTLRKVSQAIGNYISPVVYPAIAHERTDDGLDYMKVSFEGSDAPYACDGKYRIRVVDEDVLLSPGELRLRFREAENRINRGMAVSRTRPWQT